MFTSERVHHGVYCSISLFLALLHIPFPPACADEADAQYLRDTLPSGRHRIDIGLSRLDTSLGDVDVLLPSYTLAISDNMRVNMTASLVRSNLETTGADGSRISGTEYGNGDTQLFFQYDPSAHMTASPWIPESVGLSAGLLLPTGNAENALGGDTWVASLSAGRPVDLLQNFWLLPSLSYERSFHGGEYAALINELQFALGLHWLFPVGVWIGYDPELIRDLAKHEWSVDHAITLGWVSQTGLGLSLEYGSRDRWDPLSHFEDKALFLNLFYQFGGTP